MPAHLRPGGEAVRLMKVEREVMTANRQKTNSRASSENRNHCLAAPFTFVSME